MQCLKQSWQVFHNFHNNHKQKPCCTPYLENEVISRKARHVYYKIIHYMRDSVHKNAKFVTKVHSSEFFQLTIYFIQ